MDRQPICETYPNGAKVWYLDGKRHRTDGPAYEGANGHKEWWLDDKLHRTDGPAIERANGSKEWFLDGEYHRTDGPAIEWADGHKEWFLDGQEVSWQQVYHRATTDEVRLSILIAALTNP